MRAAKLLILMLLQQGVCTACAADTVAPERGVNESINSGSKPLSSCPSTSAPVSSGRISSTELDEASGLVASSANPGVFYSHNDSGGAARVYALAPDGTLLATISVSGATAVDWEDIAIGPGPNANSNYVYVGDIGDNAMSRSSIRVYRFAEPTIDLSATLQKHNASAETLRLSYPDGAHNAETLLLDPTTGDLFVLTKHQSGSSSLYVAHAPLSPTSTQTLELVTSLQFGTGALSGSPLVTGGDVSKDGSAVVIRTYSGAFYWVRSAGTTLGEAFAGMPCSVTVPAEKQGEAIAFTSDSSGYATLSEGSLPTMYRMALNW